MAKRTEIISYIENELDIHGIQDSSLNGLQFEGSEEVNKIVVAVDCGLEVIEQAVKRQAQMLIVHHGMFWGSSFAITGVQKKIFELLVKNNLNVVALHLPLDAHERLGNNFVLARILDLTDLRTAIPFGGKNIGCIGTNQKCKSLTTIVTELENLVGIRKPLLALPHGPSTPENICIVTGSGADALGQFSKEGFDTLITGEPRQFAYHFSLENKVNAIFAGHYATETLGVRELGKDLEQKFKVSSEFIDIPTGI